MARVNLILTVMLAALAVLAWTATSVHAWNTYSVPPVFLVGSLTLTSVACLGWILLNLSPRRLDGETRCRKCQHILRGLSEPRCPECGERI